MNLFDVLTFPIVVSAMVIISALWLDKWLGEPNKYHPLVMFGDMAVWIENQCRKYTLLSSTSQGVLAWIIAVIPLVLLIYALNIWLLNVSIISSILFQMVILYLTIGNNSLCEHAENIYRPLVQGDIVAARQQVSMIVSRDTDKMQEVDITSSTIESVLENGNDAVIAPIVWYVLLGIPGAVLLRLSNTLDAMWGYKTSNYIDFGWLSAKADDLLGWLPARITALMYATQGNIKLSIECWKQQAKFCSSPNGGVVMTAGAGALGITIGGPNYYHGELKDKQPMGLGNTASHLDIPNAIKLVSRGSLFLSYMWFLSVFLWSVLY
jgi:adenosylcobinamide-phosphate synthase